MIPSDVLVWILQAATSYAFIGTKGNDTQHLAKLVIVFVTIPLLQEPYKARQPTLTRGKKHVNYIARELCTAKVYSG